MRELKENVPLCAHGVLLTETSASRTLPKDRKLPLIGRMHPQCKFQEICVHLE